MGKIKQGILGGFSGKVANVVGSSWKGIAYMKALPLSVANPRTAGQVAQRTKLANCVSFSKAILAAVIKPLRDRFAVQQSGYNSFVSDNIGLFTNVVPAIEPELILSSGKMAATPIDSFTTLVASTDLVINWVNDTGEGFKLDDDEAYAVAMNEVTEEIIFSAASAQRSDATVTLAFSTGLLVTETVHMWLSFLRTDGTIVSDSSAARGATPNP